MGHKVFDQRVQFSSLVIASRPWPPLYSLIALVLTRRIFLSLSLFSALVPYVRFTMSQPSDRLIPSLFDTDSIDAFTNIVSDDITPDLSISQQSFTSETDYTQFRPPAPPPPPSLQRVGPNRNKPYILYTDMTSKEFVHWWLKTEYGSKKRIRWESSRRSSSMWENFEQVAQAHDGKAKLMCKRCGGVLDHPHNHEHGTSTMARHTKGAQCRNSSASRTKQKGIMSMIHDAVSTFITA